MINTTLTRNWQININDSSTQVYGIEDIAQCVYTILATVPGSDPLRPTFGSMIHPYLDRPLTETRPRIIYAATEAIKRWERRIEVKKCQIVESSAACEIIIEAIVLTNLTPITITTKF